MVLFIWASFVRANWWLRGVVSATNFANVNNNGNANYNNASNSNGFRPDFGNAITVSPSRRNIERRGTRPKGNDVHVRVKRPAKYQRWISPEPAPRCSCYAIE